VIEPTCDEVRELAPELALGIAAGEERARALAHIANCAECRALVDELTRTTDSLLQLAPQKEPPIGFEARAVRRVRGQQPRHRLRVAGAVASIILVSVGLTALVMDTATRRDRDLADRYLALLEGRTSGELFATPLLTDDGARAGQVFAYEGSSNWIFIVVNARNGKGVRDIVLTPRTPAASSTVGRLRLVDGRGSWGSTTGLDLRGLHVQLFDDEGKADFEAVLPAR
jgi:putative zinc finger protein